MWNKYFKTSSIDWDYLVSQQYLHTQANKIFQYLKDLKENDDRSFFEYINSSNLDKNTYIKFEFKKNKTTFFWNELLKT